MRPYQARYVTATQQLLTLAAVLAALTPATAVISMDVVEQPATPRSSVDGRTTPAATGALRPAPRAPAAAPAPAAADRSTAPDEPAEVPAAAVEPTVTEVPLTSSAAGSDGSAREKSTPDGTPDADAPEASEPGQQVPEGVTTRRTTHGEVLVSDPEPVSGYGAVGITWSSDQQVAEDSITFEVRSMQDGTWSDWGPIEYLEDEAPDPGSPDARGQRPGTAATIVGDVDEVQVRVTSRDPLPADMDLAVVDPGEASTQVSQEPAIDTGAGTAAEGPGIDEGATLDSDQGDIALQAATFTARPKIFSRAQWGADESLRDSGSLHYYEVHAGFVHHTVTSNDYSRDQVPAIIRSIYAYHTRSRGWSDIGYNFLVDRFGRIWEGRYGGVDRPVVGAHTLGYNDYAFAMSALGNYDVKQPSDAMLRAYGRLFAWKLSLHGVDAGSMSQRVGPDTFRAISGHRDAGSTACPGRYLYAKIPTIRGYAESLQQGWSGRELEDNLVGSAHPDLVARRASDGRVFVLPTGGLLGFARAVVAGESGYRDRLTVALPDVNGDGHGDLLARRPDGVTEIRPGTGRGGYGAPIRTMRGFAKSNRIVSAGDVDGDGRADVVARHQNGKLAVWLGRSDGRFVWLRATWGWAAYDVITGPGDVTGDGKVDLVVRRDGALKVRAGNGRGGFAREVDVPGKYGKYDTVAGGGDLDRDGVPDLFVRHRQTHRGWVLPGRGDGTFGHPVGPIGRMRGLTGISIGPSAGSRDPDIVATSGDRLVVRRHNGRFNLGRPIDTGLVLGNANRLMKAGDWDRDGRVDLMMRNKWGSLWLYRGRGNGTFEPGQRIAKGFGKVTLLAGAGDVTGDGWPDLVGQPRDQAMRIYPGRGLRGLARSYVAYRSLSASQQIGIGRWDRDGAPDSLIRSGSALRFYPGNGPGGLTRGDRDLGINLSPYDRVVGLSDIRGAGHPDVVVRRRGKGLLWLFQGRESGFAARRFLGEGAEGYDLID